MTNSFLQLPQYHANSPCSLLLSSPSLGPSVGTLPSHVRPVRCHNKTIILNLIHITIVPSLTQTFFPHSYRHCIPIHTTFFNIALPVEQLRSFATEVTRVARDVGTARREDSAGRPTKVGSAVHHTSHANGGAIPAGVLSTQQPSTTVRETKGKYAFADFNIQRTLGTGSFGRELGAIGRSMPLIPASHFEPMVCINGTL